jgi:hypothetical protein
VSALWLLLWLRFWGVMRRLGRGMRTVKGALLGVFFGLMFLGYVAGMIVSFFALEQAKNQPRVGFTVGTGPDGQPVLVKTDAPTPTGPDAAQVRRFGSLGLFAYCLAVMLMSSGGSGLTYSPAEVNLLFTGPFTRRQLLAYKLAQPGLVAIPVSLFACPGLFMITGTAPGGFLGLLFLFLFIQLFAVTCGLVVAAVGALAYSRARKALLGVLAAGVVLGLVGVRLSAPPGESTLEALQRLEQSAVVQTLLAPFGWFLDVFIADRVWPDLLRAVGLSVGVLAVLLGLIFALDAQFLEAAATASEKTYARIQRMRSGSVASGFASAEGKPKLTLPMPPGWGGVGPVLWRQLLTALRSLKGMTLLMLFIGLVSVGPIIAAATQDEGGGKEALSGVLIGVLAMMSMLLTNITAFDFRGDLDRMDLLKALPIAPWRVAVGQLAAPVVLASLTQSLLLVLIDLFIGGLGPVPLVAAAFTLPFNLITYGVDNLLFLIYPTRLVAAPGDLRTGLRQMVLMLGKFLILSVGTGLAAVVSALVYFLTGGSWVAALVGAWLVLAALAAPLIPLIAVAFKHFDVSSDVP